MFAPVVGLLAGAVWESSVPAVALTVAWACRAIPHTLAGGLAWLVRRLAWRRDDEPSP